MKQSMGVLTSSRSNEWWTPADWIRRVERVGGRIDLDPASCTGANEVVGARRYYTKGDDGLSRSWGAGFVFCNPPYGKVGNRSSADVWLEKAASEYMAGHFGCCIILTKCVPGYKWWSYRVREGWPGLMCITWDRIEFVNAGDGCRGRAKAASSFWFAGSDDSSERRFWQEFSEVGLVVRCGEGSR